jgi:hypothetical protein
MGEAKAMKPWRVLAVLACLSATLALKGDAIAARRLPAMIAGTPRMILWAWEEPEDLSGLDPQRAGVAFLAERVFLGSSVSGSDVRVLPRRQRIRVPEGIWAEAVVRIEAGSSFRDSDALREQTADALLQAAALPRIRALQIDFDANQSQQAFYADVLRRVRKVLPPTTGLSMTALVSWCSVEGGWMSGLPVNDAVPMYFRLGKHVGWWSIREPLCNRSLGISTDEPWTAPDIRSGKTIYIFAPKPWTAEQVALANHNRFPLQSLSDTKGGQ